MYAYVGICHAGVCALAFGIIISEAVIKNVKSTAIKIAIVLLFIFFIFFTELLIYRSPYMPLLCNAK
jgi:uncharacterized membrane protein YcaP (DUF421 family)